MKRRAKMRIIDLKTMQQAEIYSNTVVALGTFDGCHMGHLTVFRTAFLEAKRTKAKSIVYTFEANPHENKKSILTLDEKIKIIRKSGIDYVAIDDFSAVKNLDGESFVNKILIDKLKAIKAVCGFNYRFGKNAICTPKELREFFEKKAGSVLICDEISFENEVVSSTLIRNHIEKGSIERILPYSKPYSIYAKVLEGKRLGRTIGIPTINQIIPEGKIVPMKGVYITECEIGEDVYPSVTNVGTRPTVEENGQENMETHIIGYDGNLYSSYVRVNFYKKLREEKKFESIEELKKEIESNIKEAVEYFK